MLRYIAQWNVVEVAVDVDGHDVHVRPDTVQVLREKHVAFTTAYSDTSRGYLEWEPFDDRGEATRRGLVRRPSVRTDLSWDDLRARAVDAAAPLQAAGWTLAWMDDELAPDCGDSAICRLERGGKEIDVEYHEDDRLIVWPAEPSESDDTSEPLASIAHPTPRSLRSTYRRLGLI